MAKKILLQKKVGTSVESIYTKTSADIVIYDESTGQNTKDKIDSLETKEDNLIRIGTCSTAANVKDKVVTCSNFVLYTGAIIAVKFAATNSYSATASSPITLNVNNTGAKNIYYNDTANPTGTNTTAFGTASYYNYYIYDGTYWVFLSRSTDANSTYAAYSLGIGYATCTTAEATAAKVAAFKNGTYTLHPNGIVAVEFANAVPANATLNINNKGAKPIFYCDAAITNGIISGGDTATFVYDGTNYNLISINRAIDTALNSTSNNPVENKVINAALSNKVDKVSGKGLSTNDFTAAYKSALDNLSTNLDGKVDKVDGSSLMTEDEHTKLAGIAAGANKTTVDSALNSSSTNPVQNKVINTALGAKVNTSDITTTAPASTNTDAQVPSTKSMYTALNTKVDKVSGKGLSTNDFTATYKTALDNLSTNLNKKVNTSDITTATPTSENTDTQVPSTKSMYTALDAKVDKVDGSSLMTEEEHTKLAGIATGATKITVDSALSSSSTNPVQNKAINTALSGKIATSSITTSAPASTNTDAQVPSTKSMYTALATKPTATLTTAAPSSSSTDAQVPSTKSMYTALSNKVDKVSGKGLSTNDFTTEYKNKVDNTIVYCTCATAAATQVKVVDTPDGFTLFTGTVIAVKFTYTNTYNSTATAPVKLNVGGTGEKQIYYDASAANTGANSSIYGVANNVIFYMYDGTYWVWLNRNYDNNTTYSNASLGTGYATCTTAEATAAKVAAFKNGTYTLAANGIVAVKFTYAVPANATLNINNRGAKPIYFNNAVITAGVISAGDTATFFYDNTNYNVINIMHERPNIIYWGAGAASPTINSAFITGLGNSETIEKQQLDAKQVTLASGEYLYIAVPSSITSPIIKLFGFVTACSKVGTSIAVNSVNYDVYKAPNTVNASTNYILELC